MYSHSPVASSPESRIAPPPTSPPPTMASSPSPTYNAPPPVSAPPPPVSPPSVSLPPAALAPIPSPPPPSISRNVSPPFFSPPPSLAPPPNTSGGELGSGGTVAIYVIFMVLLLGIFGSVVFCVWRRNRRNNGGHIMPIQVSSPNHASIGLGNKRILFTYDELVTATNNFSDQNLLGRGGFGSVYKGSLADGRQVAVKTLRSGGGQGEREFRSEVEMLSLINHRHLVALVGYCVSQERRLLVLDFVSNNSLHFHLHGEGRSVMDWDTRLKIAVGAARGIAYLHQDCNPHIIHRDIKSSNILLDSNFEAQVSDFGLAKLAMDTDTYISTRVVGTFGYLAPEYASSGKVTQKSDVYSFGVVLLELITGRKPVDLSQPDDEGIVTWARPLIFNTVKTKELGELPDPRLNGNFNDYQMFRLIDAAGACVRNTAAKRPSMGQIVSSFNEMLRSDLDNGMKVGESQMFDPAQQSENIRLIQKMAFQNQEFSTGFFEMDSGSSSSSKHIEQNDRRDDSLHSISNSKFFM